MKIESIYDFDTDCVIFKVSFTHSDLMNPTTEIAELYLKLRAYVK